MNTLIIKRWLALGEAVRHLGPQDPNTRLLAAATSELLGLPAGLLIGVFEADQKKHG